MGRERVREMREDNGRGGGGGGRTGGGDVRCRAATQVSGATLNY